MKKRAEKKSGRSGDRDASKVMKEGKKKRGGEPTIDRSRAEALIPLIKNKQKRRELLGKLFREKQKEKAKFRRARKAAEARGEKVERQKPRTIEDMREADDTIVTKEDEEVQAEDAADEFASYFDGSRPPKIMLTTNKRPSAEMFDFLKELVAIIPRCFYHKRANREIKKMVKYACDKNFTDLIIVNEKAKRPFSLYICHLPEGPTTFFRLTRLKLAQHMKGGATSSDHNPEIILNNFDSRVGHRLGRQFAALFPQRPEFLGRRVICFHNQRDFVFFRHYRYEFDKNGERTRLQEIGPRFTLKLRWMQEGTFNTTSGEYEFLWRPDLQVSRKKFFMG
ncbi:unnamed protein product [Vitrella brassicaformis CCMP3155]|uniref:Brix domain-containing protein n=2 Tax=Vitrella brassicaformis TaxID=1169539 RepID=A0A0G4FLT4_VITBC|nr:unnamed protein product [Vitrella brassicaformis CCMP3155]|mmetsp:Transcript_10296/g.24907  ORF Transcript_10296/g.24907 Transcript_10296/m.24907 type:complete len:337 (+) Transcript_10296:60-1070(+)|eukprot:CEM14882.1 unnamed protein product [Vitrella brassicaformis CCMP3155]